MTEKEKNVAIVLAAGRGKRMGSELPKQFLLLKGKPVIYYSLKAFEECTQVDEIVLVIEEEFRSYFCEQIIEKYGFKKVVKMVNGGEQRYDSVYAGLKACKGCDHVLIHDGARPFVTEEIILRSLENVRLHRACVAGMPVKDTIKQSDADGFVEATPPRDRIWIVQTPQVFSYELVYSAYTKMFQTDTSGVTDDAMVVETYGNTRVKLIEGSYENIKITTPEDLVIGEALLL